MTSYTAILICLLKKRSSLWQNAQIPGLPILENERIAGIVALGDLSVKKDTDQKNGEALSEISNQHNKR
ncbi:hypothetical protein [Bacillus tequilensis]|uniref:hypothetical protein n=1 Tax=Bacillus tequilensis TaxID=227866 RepID=UPI001F10A0CC|nr:hypothetical protein [Bacillus tequilensis]